MFADIVKISSDRNGSEIVRLRLASSMERRKVMIASRYYHFLLSVSNDGNITNDSANAFDFPRNR